MMKTRVEIKIDVAFVPGLKTFKNEVDNFIN